MVSRSTTARWLALTMALSLSMASGCSRAQDKPKKPTAESNTPAFDGNAAFALLNKQVDIGPRYPTSAGHAQCAKFIEDHLKATADEVSTQEFAAQVSGGRLKLKNIIAWFNPRASRFVLIGAHWDTRPIADFEINESKRAKPIPGANDGASGTALLMQLASEFKKKRPDVGVMLVFFDGEDYATPETAHDGRDMLLGSRYFAKNVHKIKGADGNPVTIAYGIIVDMVGDKDLQLPKEQLSVDAAPEVVENVWSTARRLGYENVFTNGVKYSVSDDHIPLIKAGIKCIDIIDFDYAPWHTLDDTVDKCSAESLRKVGEVVAEVVYSEKSN